MKVAIFFDRKDIIVVREDKVALVREATGYEPIAEIDLDEKPIVYFNITVEEDE